MSGSIQVDASIPLRAGQGVPAPANPMAQYGDFLRLQSAVNQNKLFPGVQQRQQQDIQLGDQAIAAGQLKQAADRGTAAYRTFGPLLAKGTAVTPDDVYGALGQASAIGLPVDAAIQEAHASMPVGGDPKTLGVRMADWVKGRFGTTLSGPEQVGAFVGTPGEQQTGGTIDAGVRRGALAGGGFAPATRTDLTMSPAQAGAPETRVLPNGQSITAPAATFAPQAALPPQLRGAAPNLGTGRYPGSDAGATQAIPGAGGTASVGPVPGQVQAMEKAAIGASGAGNEAYAAAEKATTMKSQLNNMEADLNQMQVTGPGSARMAMANAITHKYAGFGITMTPEELAASENFAKVAKQIAIAQSGALGVATDESRTMATGANPNLDLSKLGNKQILAMLKGNADAIIAKGRAWDQWVQAGHPPDSYNTFQTQFNKDFDPRVYQWNYQIQTMTPEQRAKAYDAMPDKAQFRKNYNAAVERGLIAQ